MICYRCKKDLPPESFYARAKARKHPGSRSAYSGYCKDCQYLYAKRKRWREEEEAEKREQQTEEYRERCRRWRIENDAE